MLQTMTSRGVAGRVGVLVILLVVSLLYLKRRADRLLRHLNVIGCSPRKLVEWIVSDTTFQGDKADLIPAFAHRLLVIYPKIISTGSSTCVVDLKNKTGHTWRFMLQIGNPTSMRTCVHTDGPHGPILKSEILQLTSAALILAWQNTPATPATVRNSLLNYQVRLFGVGNGTMLGIFNNLFNSNVEAYETETLQTAEQYFGLSPSVIRNIKTTDFRMMANVSEVDVTICDVGRSPALSHLMADRNYLDSLRTRSRLLVVGVAHHQQYPMLSIIPAWVSVFKNIAVIHAGKEVRILIGAGYKKQSLDIPANTSDYLDAVLQVAGLQPYTLDPNSVKVFTDKV